MSRKQERFRQSWRSELIDKLEVSDIRVLAGLLSFESTLPSPSGTAFRRIIEGILASEGHEFDKEDALRVQAFHGSDLPAITSLKHHRHDNTEGSSSREDI